MKCLFLCSTSFTAVFLLSQESVASEGSSKEFDSVSPKASSLNASAIVLAPIDLAALATPDAPKSESPPSAGSTKKKSPREPIKRPSAIQVTHVPLTKAERVLGKEPDLE